MASSTFPAQHPTNTLTPDDPYHYGKLYFTTFVGVGILLGLNWKRLGRPEWVKRTVAASIAIPLVSLVVALGWMLILLPLSQVPSLVVFSLPAAALGINFGYILSLVRLQKAAHQKWKTQGVAAMLAHTYNFGSAIRFGALVAAGIALFEIAVAALSG